MSDKFPKKRGLFLIAVLKLASGALFLAAGIGLLSLLGKDVDDLCQQLATELRIDPDTQYLNTILTKLTFVDDRKLKQISAGTFFYAALMLTEGVGLAMRKRWAEFLTVIATSSLIPLELYEIARHITWIKVVILGVNLVIVAYMIIQLRRQGRPHATAAVTQPATV